MKAVAKKVAVPVTLDTLTKEHIATAIDWLAKMSAEDRWNLKNEECCDLLGGISIRNYLDLRSKAKKILAKEEDVPLSITRDMGERLSLLTGIWKALQIIVPSNRLDLAYKWFNQPNTGVVLMGKSIKDYLIERKSIEGLYTVRRYLDSLRG